MVGLYRYLKGDFLLERLSTTGFKATNEKEDLTIYFKAVGRKGGCYTKIDSLERKGKTYRAQRFHYKYVSLVSELGSQLVDNNFVWDEVVNKPALDAKIEAMEESNLMRIKEGKKPLYDESYISKLVALRSESEYKPIQI